MEKDLYISLIYKNLKGIATSEEQAMLEAASAENRANASLRQEIELTWQLSNPTSFPGEIDVENDLLKIKQKLNHATGKPEAKVVSLRPMRRILSIAAGLLILVGVGFWALNSFGGSQMKTFEAMNGSKTFAMSDGTEVWLKEGSKLSFEAPFEENLRAVNLEGEAFFDVARNEAAPFVIQAKNSKVTVLGTSFNVKETATETTVSVESGRVRLEGGGGQVELTKGERGVHVFAKKEVTKTNGFSQNDLAWKTGRFIFKSETVGAIAKRLEQHFDISISIEKTEMLACEISAVMSAKDKKTVLEKFAKAGRMDIEKTGENSFTLKNGLCE